MLSVQSFIFSPLQENTYLLYNEKGDACIIDPGCYFEGESDQLETFIVNNSLIPSFLLTTHCHLDHVFGLKWAAARYNLVPNIHRAEEKVLAMATMAGDIWNMPFTNYKGILHWLSEGQQITIGTDVLEVLEVPGHSPGHVCFYCKAQGFVIGGDVLFKGSIGRTDLPGGNHSVLLNSIKEKLWPLPDATIVYSGHGDTTTIGFEKANNPYLQAIH